MKKYLLLAVIILPLWSFGQSGVAFLKNGNLKTVFDAAKAQNKKVFIEVYSPTCHVCQSFMPVFENNQVGNAYNSSYISYKLEINTAEANAFLFKQGIWVPSLPLLLYFDKDVNLQHITILGEGQDKPQTLVTSVEIAQDPNRRLTSLNSRFQSGERDPNFLIDYGFMLRIKKDTITNIKVMEAYSEGQKANMDNQTNFLVLQKIILDSENSLFKHLMSNLVAFQKKHTTNTVKQVAESILMSTLFSSRANNFTPTKIAQIASNLEKIGVDKKSVENRTLLAELNAFFRLNQPANALSRIDRYIKSANPGPKEYEFLATYVKQKSKDKAFLEKALEWSKKK
jgi:thiol-disulfide isomerase/thioredoxin